MRVYDGGMKLVLDPGDLTTAAPADVDVEGTPDTTTPDDPETTTQRTIPWVLAVEGSPTGDGRLYQSGAFVWRDLPLPFMATDVTAQAHDGAQLVGNIIDIERKGSEIVGTVALIDSTDERVQYLQSLIENRDLRGVSVDMDEIKGSLVVTPEDPDTEMAPDEDGNVRVNLAMPTAEFTHARIIGATALPFPAFAEAQQAVLASGLFTGEGSALFGDSTDTAQVNESDILLVREALGDDEDALAAFARLVDELPDAADPDDDDDDDTTTDEDPDALMAAATLVQPPVHPPESWFQEPATACPHTVEDSGQVYGMLATWHQCHIGIPGKCVTAPRSELGYAAFLTGELVTNEGTRLRVGQITVDCGHAGRKLGHRAAAEHYDHTGWVAADVVIGENEAGIWYAGALRPDLDPVQVRKVLASDVSGDWRSINGNLELVAIASVNVPGFPKLELMVASGEVETLVMPAPEADCSDVGDERIRLRIAASIGRTPEQRAAERDALAYRVGRHPSQLRNALRDRVHA